MRAPKGLRFRTAVLGRLCHACLESIACNQQGAESLSQYMTRRIFIPYARIALALLAAAFWIQGMVYPVAAQTTTRLTVPSVSAAKGKIVAVKISVTGIQAPGLRDFQGKLTFNSQTVKAQAVTGLNGYSIAAVNFDTAGEVRFIGFKVSGTLITQGEFVQIDVQAIGNTGDKSPLELKLQSFNTPNGAITYEVTNGQLTVTSPQTLQANFTFEPANPQVNQEIKFSDKSTGGGNVNSWTWDFGDNTTGNIQNPTHKYTESGNYTVKLTVQDDQNNTSSVSMTLTLLRPGERPTVPIHVFPNPPKSSATFNYSLPQKTTKATLFIFDMTGRMVFRRDLVTSVNTFAWNLRDMDNTTLPNGPYYYVVRASAQDEGELSSSVHKLVIQR